MDLSDFQSYDIMSFLWPLSILLIAVCTKVAVAMTYRKEIRNMTTEEMDSYFSAIWTYKKEGRKDVSFLSYCKGIESFC